MKNTGAKLFSKTQNLMDINSENWFLPKNDKPINAIPRVKQ